MATIKIHNIETNEQIERELTDEEVANLVEASKVARNIKAAEQSSVQSKKAALEKLGLTEEEAKLLFA